MESRSMVVSSMLATFLVLHLGLIHVMAQQSEVQIGVAGQTVTLNCGGIPHKTEVTWKYNNNNLLIRQYGDNYLKGKATMANRSEIDRRSKHLKVLDLRLSDAGTYTCEYDSHVVSISLHVLQLTISSDGCFLANEVPELTLMQSSSRSLPDLTITVSDHNKNTVRSTPSENTTRQKYILKLKQLEVTDSGTWMCHIHSDSPLINQNISFDVKVLGFGNPNFKRKYVTVDSTVILSWLLNFQKIKWKEGFTGQLNWKQQESATAHELLNFSVTAQGEQHETQKSSHFWFEIPESKPEGTIKVELPKVHFNHSGQYKCELAYKGRFLQSRIDLVVMKVSASHAGPLPRGAEMTLTCQVSGPLASNAHLLWERVNGTEMDIRKSEQHEVKVKVSAAGLWNCHLIEDNDRKISLHYPVEETPVWNSYVTIGASIGGSVLTLGLACLCIISSIRWQRRRQHRKRMAQARQYLLENKTCQCQRWLNK
ncbi:T-cell surface glycoprotein CD4-like [Pezoporus flaviventris]|uniref:T-cell surface glycoprotein CD4-like n=1 Tax=Pezoporus flaviventris TaxID=889875 RepID=UPI002AAF2022|nr:T-cell surface glycoprotein CD4-like [Pezoporus flaviventris]